MQATSLIQILVQPGTPGQSTGNGANAGDGAALLSAAGGPGNLFQATLGELLSATPVQAAAGQGADTAHPAGQIVAALLPVPAEAAGTATDAITAANAASGTTETGAIPLAALLPDGAQAPLTTATGQAPALTANPVLNGQIMTKGEVPAGTDTITLATAVANTPVASAGPLIPGHGQTQTPDAAPDGQVLATAKGAGFAPQAADTQPGTVPPGLDQAAAVTSGNGGKAAGLATAQTAISTNIARQADRAGSADGPAVEMAIDPAVTTALSGTPEHQAQARQAAGEVTPPASQNETLKNETLKEGQAPLPLPAGEAKAEDGLSLKPQAGQAGQAGTPPDTASPIAPQGNAKSADTAGGPQAASTGGASAAGGKASAPAASGTGTETSGLRADATAQPSQPLHNQQLSQPLQAAQAQQAEAPQQVQDLKQADAPRMDTPAQPQGQQATQSQAVREGMVSANLTRSDAAQRAVVQTVGLEITRAANARETSFTLRLDPPDLGRVEARLQFGQDGAVRAIVTADNRETLTLLQRDAGHLERALADAGLKPDSGSLSFNLKQQAQGNGQQDANGSGRMANASELAADDEAEDMAAAHEMEQVANMVRDGRVDIRI